VEAAGHYHQPLTSAGVLPADWQLVQVSPAQVAAQRQLAGRRRVQTDALDLVAISDLLQAGHGVDRARLSAVMGELAAWVAHRERRLTVRTALRNQLLGQVDRASPGSVAVPPACSGPRSAGRSWLAGGPGCHLWRRDRRPSPVAQRPAGVSGQRAVPSDLRLGRPPLRWRRQSGRVGHPAPGRTLAGRGILRAVPGASPRSSWHSRFVTQEPRPRPLTLRAHPKALGAGEDSSPRIHHAHQAPAGFDDAAAHGGER
jgi:hypothetical protein